MFHFLCNFQSDNRTDDVDKRQPNDVQHHAKAAADAINNNNNNGSRFNSTALIKDVIHKKPAVEATKIVNRERDYSYDDAIEDYKTRVSKAVKLDLPKVDIHKRRELFEKEQKDDNVSTSASATKLGTEIVSIKDRISSLRSNLATSTVAATPPKKVEPLTTTKLKDRLSSLSQLASPVDEPKRNPIEAQFKNVQEVRSEFESKTAEHQNHNGSAHSHAKLSVNDDNESLESTDREDSGIQTTDVSCSVSQADEQTDQQIDEFQHVIQEKITKLNVGGTTAASDTAKADADDEMEPQEDESSVSCSDDDQTQSVLVLNLHGATNNDAKSPNDAILDFIQCNLLDEHPQLDDVQMDNNYVYECIINRSEHQKSSGLEKSNSIDTALSLCSSSDGQSLMDDADEKIHR